MSNIKAVLFIKENPYGKIKSSTLYVFKELLTHSEQINNKIKFILFCNNPPTEKLPKNVAFQKVGNPYTFQALIQFLKYIKNNRVDVVISFDISGILPIIYAKIFKIPTIVINFAANNIVKLLYTRDIRYFEPIKTILQLICFALADKIITAGSFGIENNKPFRHKITPIGHGVNTKIFRVLRSIERRDNKILFVGKCEKRKGLDVTFKVFSSIIDKIPNLTLCIVGDKNEYVRKLIEKYIPKDKQNLVIFKNNLNLKNLVEEYNSAKIFILLSRYDGWGLVVTEALACGTPVIISTKTGAKDVVEKYGCGFVVDLKDKDRIIDCLIRLLTDNKLWEKMSKNAIKAVEYYTWDKIANKFLKCILNETIQ